MSAIHKAYQPTRRSRRLPSIVDTFGAIGKQAAEFLKLIAQKAWENRVITVTTSMEHAVGQYRWRLVQRLGAAIAHTNSNVEEVRVRATHHHASIRVIYAAAKAKSKRSAATKGKQGAGQGQGQGTSEREARVTPRSSLSASSTERR